MIRLSQDVNPFFVEELLLHVGSTRHLKIQNGDIEMGLLPRRQPKEDPPPQLTPRQRFEQALERVKTADALLQRATNKHAEFLAKNRDHSLTFSEFDAVHEMTLPNEDASMEQRLREEVGDALKEFNSALAVFAEQKMILLGEGVCV